MTNELSDAELFKYTGQTAIRDLDTAIELHSEAVAANRRIRRRLLSLYITLPFLILRKYTTILTIGSLVADACIVGIAISLPLSISVFALAKPSKLASFLIAFTTFVLAGLLYYWFSHVRAEEGDDPFDYRANKVTSQKSEIGRLKHARRLALKDKSIYEHIRYGIDEALHKYDEINSLIKRSYKYMLGHDFEYYLREVFEFLGYDNVIVTKGSGDHGVDLIAVHGINKIAIQAKRYEGTVGNKAIQEAFTGMVHYGCTRCAVVTNSTFTKAAFEIAVSTNCTLIDGERLRGLIRSRSML